MGHLENFTTTKIYSWLSVHNSYIPCERDISTTMTTRSISPAWSLQAILLTIAALLVLAVVVGTDTVEADQITPPTNVTVVPLLEGRGLNISWDPEGSNADNFTALDDDSLFVEGQLEVDAAARFDGLHVIFNADNRICQAVCFFLCQSFRTAAT